MKRKGLSGVVCCTLLIAFIGVVLVSCNAAPEAALHSRLTPTVVVTPLQGQGGVNTVCSLCHSIQISANCLSCHPSPPTRVINRSFPHHRTQGGGEAPNNCRLSGCHDGTANDVRFVQAPVASAAYCDACHEDDD